MRVPIRYQFAGVLVFFLLGVGLYSLHSTQSFLLTDKISTLREIQALDVAQISSDLRENIFVARQKLREAAARLIDPSLGPVTLDPKLWAWLRVKNKFWLSPELKTGIQEWKGEIPDRFSWEWDPNEKDFLNLGEPLTLQGETQSKTYWVVGRLLKQKILGKAEDLDRGPIRGLLLRPIKKGSTLKDNILLSSPEGLEEVSLLSSKVLEGLQNFIASTTQTKSLEIPAEQDKENLFVSQSQVSFPDSLVSFSILSFVDRGSILKGFKSFISEQIFWALIFIGFALLFAMLLARRLSKPIEELVQAARILETGDFKVRVSAQRKDEIGDLGGAFNHMALSLEQREEDLKNAQNALIQNEKLAALGTLSAGIAHEVKNPLAGILGNADMAFNQVQSLNLPSGNSLMRYIEIIQKETKRCRGIIDSLMRFSRQEKAEQGLVDLELVTWEAIHLLEHSLNMAQVRLDKKFSDNLQMIYGNANQIEQVLLNMIQNSAHAMPEGGTVTVSTEYYPDPSQAPVGNFEAYCSGEFKGPFSRVSISDTGIGMTEEVQRKIFEPFFTTKPKGVGTGLGLSVTMGILGDHQARITLTSAPGKGTTFFIDFMAKQARIQEVITQLEEVRHRKGGGAKLSSDVGSTPSSAEVSVLSSAPKPSLLKPLPSSTPPVIPKEAKNFSIRKAQAKNTGSEDPQ